MFLTSSLTKKELEKVLKNSISALKHQQALKICDIIKGIGFYYATSSGLSISLCDLRTPQIKDSLIQKLERSAENISRLWGQGLASDIRRYKKIMDGWIDGSDKLQKYILSHFSANDPLNSLYVMAFSGARGNMSQVRQVIGMRGLMVNQEGKIIDSPIQSNFREGLNPIEYLVSSYGARKGVVDTALKTANAGYLTRRLIFIAQEVTVKLVNCKTKKFRCFILTSNSNIENLIGKTLIKAFYVNGGNIDSLKKDCVLCKDNINVLKSKGPIIVYYKSLITCDLKSGVCQSCYGWDFSTENSVDLGTAVGIIAAQSIGEPGTQLTMRTFHTGGAYSGGLSKENSMLESGSLRIPKLVSNFFSNDNEKKALTLIKENISATFTNLSGKKKTFYLKKGTLLKIGKSAFVRKGQKMFSLWKKKCIESDTKWHEIKSPLEGLVFSKLKPSVKKLSKMLYLAKSKYLIWLASGHIFKIPLKSLFIKRKHLNQYSAIAFNKISIPFCGLIEINCTENYIKIASQNIIAKLNFSKNDINFCEFNSVIKNFSFADAQTILGFYSHKSEKLGSVYKVKEKVSKFIKPKKFVYLLMENDVWKVTHNDHRFFKKKRLIFTGDMLSSTIYAPSSGIFLEKKGFIDVYQKAGALCLNKGTLIRPFSEKYLTTDDVLGYVPVKSEHAEDIVQGLPKIEKIIESRNNIDSSKMLSEVTIGLANWYIKQPKIFYNQESKSKHAAYFSEFSTIHLHADKSDENNILEIEQNLTKKKELCALFIKSLHSNYLSKNSTYNLSAHAFKNSLNIKEQNFLNLFNNLKLISKIKFKPALSLTILRKALSNALFSKSLVYYIKNTTICSNLKLKVLRPKNIKIKNSNIACGYLRSIKKDLKSLYSASKLFEPGAPIISGCWSSKSILKSLFYYHLQKHELDKGCFKCLSKILFILINSVQYIYNNQGVRIKNVHIEIVLRELLSKAKVIASPDGTLLANELISIESALALSKIYDYFDILEFSWEPIIQPLSKTVISKKGFIAAASFQEVKNVLSKASIEGSYDWIKGIKESVIMGRQVPAGSGFCLPKNYLNTLFYYKKKYNYYKTKTQ